jgi:hypothetical protein
MQANSEIKTLSSVSSLPTAQLVQYVQTLPLHQKQSIFDTLQQDPEVKESRSVLPYKSPLPLAKGYCNKPHPSSSRDIAPFFKQCYDNICTGKVDEQLLDDVLDVVLLRVDEAFTPTKVEEVKQAMERQLALASRRIKGEACEKCGPGYKSSNPGSVRFHYGMADDIRCLEEILTDLDLEVELSNKGKYSLHKLFLVFPDCYSPYQHLFRSAEMRGYDGWKEQLDEMWCHNNPVCDCWDRPFDCCGDEGHCKNCSMSRK